MRNKLLAAVLLSAGALAVSAAPAGAVEGPGSLCLTAHPTPVYANPDFTGYLFTLSPGRGFRAHSGWGEDSTLLGAYGHGAERPDRDGYVRGHHLPGC